jgi:hypothetical protein
VKGPYGFSGTNPRTRREENHQQMHTRPIRAESIDGKRFN